jgi:hypothetical protein
MATKHFHVRHGLTAGTGVDNSGTPTREVITSAGQLVDVGALTSLTTSNKTNLVAAVNEVKNVADGNATVDDIIALAIALG